MKARKTLERKIITKGGSFTTVLHKVPIPEHLFGHLVTDVLGDVRQRKRVDDGRHLGLATSRARVRPTPDSSVGGSEEEVHEVLHEERGAGLEV